MEMKIYVDSLRSTMLNTDKTANALLIVLFVVKTVGGK